MRRVRPRRHDGPQCGEALRLTCGFPLKRRLEAGPGGGLASCCPEITPFMGRARSPKSHTMRLRLTGRLGRRDGREAQLTGRPTGRPSLCLSWRRDMSVWDMSIEALRSSRVRSRRGHLVPRDVSRRGHQPPARHELPLGWRRECIPDESSTWRSLHGSRGGGRPRPHLRGS